MYLSCWRLMWGCWLQSVVATAMQTLHKLILLEVEFFIVLVYNGLRAHIQHSILTFGHSLAFRTFFAYTWLYIWDRLHKNLDVCNYELFPFSGSNKPSTHFPSGCTQNIDVWLNMFKIRKNNQPFTTHQCLVFHLI